MGREKSGRISLWPLALRCIGMGRPELREPRRTRTAPPSARSTMSSKGATRPRRTRSSLADGGEDDWDDEGSSSGRKPGGCGVESRRGRRWLVSLFGCSPPPSLPASMGSTTARIRLALSTWADNMMRYGLLTVEEW